jgi:hypothetical protein
VAPIRVAGPWLRTFGLGREDACVDACRDVVQRLVTSTAHGAVVVTGDAPERAARVRAACDHVVAGTGWSTAQGRGGPAALAARIKDLTGPDAPVELVIHVGADGRMAAVALSSQPGGFR